jgi:excisionase family DNA binding protein
MLAGMSTADATHTVSRADRIDRSLPALLTTSEVAELLRVSPRTVDRWAIEGRLPRVQIARAVRYRADDIAALIDPTTNGAPAGNRGSEKDLADVTGPALAL